jgi:hypothetical protein
LPSSGKRGVPPCPQFGHLTRCPKSGSRTPPGVSYAFRALGETLAPARWGEAQPEPALTPTPAKLRRRPGLPRWLRQNASTKRKRCDFNYLQRSYQSGKQIGSSPLVGSQTRWFICGFKRFGRSGREAPASDGASPYRRRGQLIRVNPGLVSFPALRARLEVDATRHFLEGMSRRPNERWEAYTMLLCAVALSRPAAPQGRIARRR